MKRHIAILIAATGIPILGGLTLHGQNTTVRGGQAEAAEMESAARETQSQIKTLREQVGKARQDVQHAQAFAENSPTFATSLRGSPRSYGKLFIIRTSETGAKEQGNLEEDLAVMWRILGKTLTDNLGGEPRARAMGIDVVFVPGPAPMRSMYLDGYGALFMLNVGFPLLPPPSLGETDKEKAPADSTWEAAKRELYGEGRDPQMVVEAAEPYDDEQVTRLKNSLLEAIKNAANIRGLKADDSVTVCVFGGPSVTPAKRRGRSMLQVVPMKETNEPPPRSGAIADRRTQQWIISSTADTSGPFSAASSGTVLTIRVKKSDVDAFSQGKLNSDQFRKKANIIAYPAIPEPGRETGR